MIRVLFLTIILALIISSCTCKDCPMQITPIEDTYAAQNRGTPNTNIFLIKNFKDNKEGLIYFFNYLEDSIKPRIPLNDDLSYCHFVYNKNDVVFDDGSYEMTTNRGISVLREASLPYFFGGIDFYPNKQTNKYIYTIKKHNNFVDIVMDYKQLKRKSLKEFLDVFYDYKEDGWIEKTYRLVRESDNKIEVIITYPTNKNDDWLGFDLQIIEDTVKTKDVVTND